MNKAVLFLAIVFHCWFSTTAQDIPFSEKFFPGRGSEVRAALSKITAGDEYFLYGKQTEYKFAIPFYESAQKFNPSNASLNYKLGACYLMVHKKELALQHLNKAIDLNPELEQHAYYYQALALQKLTKWDEAILVYTKYGELIKGSIPIEDVTRKIEECKNGKVLSAKPIKVRIENLGATINTQSAEYTPLITADESKLYFTSRRLGGTGNQTDGEDLDYFEDIYVSDQVNGQWTISRNLGPPVNTVSHDAGAGLSPDGKTLFVFMGKKNGGDILVSRFETGSWTTPGEMGKNISTRYHESTACISGDGKTFYFSSDRPGGYGGRDIYKSVWDSTKKQWGTAINLGSLVNTQYDEEGAYLHSSGSTLYFSSKGHNSIGGYDIFYSVLYQGNWQKPTNAGYPLNTPDDDVYFVISGDGNHGYYSSVRNETFGETDIYKITFLSEADKPVARMLALSGVVTDATTRKPVAATLELTDMDSQASLGKYMSDKNTGTYSIILPAGKRYGLFAFAGNYLFESALFEVADTVTYRDSLFNIVLKPLESGNSIVLNNVFFDTDKSTLKEASFNTLNKLAKLMQDYDALTAEIGGHTDSDGKDDYNMKLSESRARSVAEYLVAAGIEKSRVTFKGYGESKPLFPNTTAENMAKNRRIEFRVNSR